MEIVICLCLKCDARLGRFRNSWNGIGNTYFSPVHRPVSCEGLEGTGDSYEGAQGSHIENSLLQDLACIQCQHIVGLRCDSAPARHLLQPNQLILRLAEMSVVSEVSGTKAKISVLKSIPLTSSSAGRSVSEARRGSVSSIHSGRPKPPRLLPSVSQALSAGGRISTPEPTPPQVEVTKFKAWAEDAIKIQQQDIERISGSVSRIEKDMQLFKDFVQEMRAERSFRQHLQTQQNQEGLVTFRVGLDDFRQQVNSNSAGSVARGEFERSRESLDTLSKDVQLVDQKVDDIDAMKRELEQLKERLYAMEKAATTACSCPTQNIEAREAGLHRKRKHGDIDVDDPDFTQRPEKSPEFPSTRRQTIHRSLETPNVPNRRSRLVIEIPSWNITPTPLIPDGDDDWQGQIYAEDGENDDHQSTTPTTPLLVSQHTFDEETPIPLADPSLERILHLKKVIEPDSQMLDTDKMKGRKRAPNGILLTKAGKLDRRSLRLLNLIEDGENRSPSRSSTAFETPQREQRVHKEHATNAACKSGKGNISPDGFPCDMCGKTFNDLQNLNKHRCVGELERQATLEDRERILSERASTVNALERRLTERETLLRQTLERETTALPVR